MNSDATLIYGLNPLTVGPARGDARRFVQGKLNRLDELTRRLLGVASAAPKMAKATQQADLF